MIEAAFMLSTYIFNIMKAADLTQFKVSFSGRHPHRYRAYNLNIPENQPLKEKLEQDGFCGLHCTNNLNIVYEHQIVAYYNCGGIHAGRRGFKAPRGIISCHHINGNTFDNRPQNLIYLQDDLHNEITKSQRRIRKGLKVWSETEAETVTDLVPIWNRQGRPIKNIQQFVLRVLTQTLVNTAITMRLEVKAKRISRWMSKIRKKLSSVFNLPCALPDWIGNKLESLYLT